MRLQIASDLHLDYFQPQWPGFRLIEPAEGADALALAGDIAHGTQAIDLFADWPVPVLYVTGNHEPYDLDRQELVAELRRRAQGTAVRFLENDCVEAAGARFLGATLWSDFDLVAGEREAAMQRAQARRSDFKKIGFEGRAFRAEDSRALHRGSRAFLARSLSEPFDGPTVVISHHAPHGLSLTPDWAQSIQGAPFASDCSELFGGVDLWVHGHIHHTRDYTLMGARVIANPCGYLAEVRQGNYDKGSPLSAQPQDKSQWENPGFDPFLVVEVA